MDHSRGIPYRLFSVIILILLFFVSLSGISSPVSAQTNTITFNARKNSFEKDKAVGRLKLAVVWGQKYKQTNKIGRVMAELTSAMNKYTGVETTLQQHLELSSQNLMNYPIIFILTNDLIEMSPLESENLKKYIERGGFIFADTNVFVRPNPDMKAGDSLREMLRDVIPNTRFTPIPNSDPLYHCFFDFPDGPPGAQRYSHRPYLEGVYYNGRLVAVYSDKGLLSATNFSGLSDSLGKMCVNLMIYSMIQEGSIVNRL